MSMDEVRRARLIERRRLAQIRAQRAALSEAFRAVAPGLRARGVRCAKLMPERCRTALGRLASGPGRDERLLWKPIPNGVCRPWQTERERDSLLAAGLAACAAPETPVAVVWHPCRAGLRLAASALAANAAEIINASAGDTIWIVAADGGPWLIEIAYWDREICWTPRMPVWAEERLWA